MAKKTVKTKRTIKRRKKVTDLVVCKESAIQVSPTLLTEAEVTEAFDLLGITSKLTDPVKKRLFTKVALMHQLNPLKREIHAAEIQNTLVPVVGYEVYIDRAEATGRLEYWHIEEAGEVDLDNWKRSTFTVTLIAKRRDQTKEFRWPVSFSEAVGLKDGKPNYMWGKRPKFMTRKCAIAQGLRLLFRDILRGIPFIEEELGDEVDERTAALKEPQAVSEQPAQAEPMDPTDAQVEEEKRQAAVQLETVQKEVQAVFNKCKASGLFKKLDEKTAKPELQVMLDLAVANKEKIENLRDIAVAWQIELADRMATGKTSVTGGQR